ncbi:hypothetical protein J1614_002883 [Plenodomus biglobosus]|nr:hypothetical protein J1614_002883 [Plenodomus biglobosus]
MAVMTTILDGLSSLANLTPYHVISYGTLLGTSLYQTFVMTKVCYRALPMSAFTTLQKRVFPVYFRSQTALLILTAMTLPPYGPVSLFSKKKDWIPLGFASGLALLNLFVYGPRTQTTMIERIHQETRDGRKCNDPGISDEQRAKNRAFSRAHAMSIHLNLMAVIATVLYGLRLGSRMNLTEQTL